MGFSARTPFTNTKAFVRSHDSGKASQAREKRACEKAARQQGKVECSDWDAHVDAFLADLEAEAEEEKALVEYRQTGQVPAWFAN